MNTPFLYSISNDSNQNLITEKESKEVLYPYVN